MNDRVWAEEAARLLDGEAYPDGDAWRCSVCGFNCGDEGPDNCPNDGHPLTRSMLSFKINPPF